jgi:hypothetical protein
MSNLVGEYVSRCLFSKTWTLREAAVYKIRLLLKGEFESNPGIAACITALAAVVKHTSDDKIAQVFTIGLGLLDDILGALAKYVLYQLRV